jgi:hypothetical protein
MEGKELHDEDDSLKSGSKKDKEQESDDFGLPDASFGSESEEEEQASEEESSFEYTLDPEPEEEQTGFGEFEEEDTPTYRYTPGEEEKRGTPTGLIVFLSLLGVLIIVFIIYWFFIRSPREGTELAQQDITQQEVMEEPEPQQPIIEEPVEQEPEPLVMEEPEEMSTGGFETINTQTGRYYIVLNSFFDGDLASDYAKDLADRGVSTLILAPPDRKGFHRVAIEEDFGGWSAAENRMNELKGTYGEDIWVLKY